MDAWDAGFIPQTRLVSAAMLGDIARRFLGKEVFDSSFLLLLVV